MLSTRQCLRRFESCRHRNIQQNKGDVPERSRGWTRTQIQEFFKHLMFYFCALGRCHCRGSQYTYLEIYGDRNMKSLSFELAYQQRYCITRMKSALCVQRTCRLSISRATKIWLARLTNKIIPVCVQYIRVHVRVHVRGVLRE